MKYIQRIVRDGSSRYYFRSPTGFRVAMPAAGPESADFRHLHMKCMERFEAESARAKATRQERQVNLATRAMTRAYLVMTQKTRKRARELGVDCGVSDRDVLRLALQQNDRCALTGIPFSLGKSRRGGRRPFAPSLDRVETSLGYVLGNVRIVCQIANYARLDFSDDEFYAMCRAAVSHLSGH